MADDVLQPPGHTYLATDGPLAGVTVGPDAVANREPQTIPLDQRRQADCLNLLMRCRRVFDNIAAGRMNANDAIDMAQYVEDAIGHDTTDQAPIEHLSHRCLPCGDYFEHTCGEGSTEWGVVLGGAVSPVDYTPDTDGNEERARRVASELGGNAVCRTVGPWVPAP